MSLLRPLRQTAIALLRDWTDTKDWRSVIVTTSLSLWVDFCIFGLGVSIVCSEPDRNFIQLGGVMDEIGLVFILAGDDVALFTPKIFSNSGCQISVNCEFSQLFGNEASLIIAASLITL